MPIKIFKDDGLLKTPVATVADLANVTSPEQGETRLITSQLPKIVKYTYTGVTDGWKLDLPEKIDDAEKWTDGRAYDADVSFIFTTDLVTAKPFGSTDKLEKGKPYLARYVDTTGAPVTYTANGLTIGEIAKMQIIGVTSSATPDIKHWKAGNTLQFGTGTDEIPYAMQDFEVYKALKPAILPSLSPASDIAQNLGNYRRITNDTVLTPIIVNGTDTVTFDVGVVREGVQQVYIVDSNATTPKLSIINHTFIKDVTNYDTGIDGVSSLDLTPESKVTVWSEASVVYYKIEKVVKTLKVSNATPNNEDILVYDDIEKQWYPTPNKKKIIRYTTNGAIQDIDHIAILEQGCTSMTLASTTVDRLVEFYRTSSDDVSVVSTGEEIITSVGITTDSTIVLNSSNREYKLIFNGAGNNWLSLT